LWERLRGAAWFLTGGTGFFGRWLLESFAAANRRFDLRAQALVLTRQPEAFRARAPGLCGDAAIRLIEGDVRAFDAETVRVQLGSSAPPEVRFVIHAASETSQPANREHPLRVLETALEGTRRALDFAVHMRAQSFLLTSSGAVYGDQPASLTHVREDFAGAPDISAPLSAYGEGKRLAEMLCHIYTREHGLHCKVARCFAFVGPFLKLDAHYAIGNFLRDALAGGAIRVTGDGTPVRSYLYAADLAVWLWTLLLREDAAGAYNVGSDAPLSIREIAACVSRQCPHRPPVAVAQPSDPKRPAPRYVPDIGRARRELGAEVWTPLETAVRRTLTFLQHPESSLP
jgi:dTDP-glucose 4,6-dehydratase